MTSTTVTLSRPSRRSRLGRRRALIGMAYAAPAAVFVLVLFVVPLATVGRMSVSRWTLLGGDRGITGEENLRTVLADPLLWPSVLFTLQYTLLTTVIMFPIALALALLLQQSRRWNAVIRTALLLPSALGLASASLLFFGLYSPAIGPLSPALTALGLVDQPVSFLGTPAAALWSTIALVVWRFTGFTMLLLLIGLQAIPDEVYEAATLDGATRLQTLRDITLPLLRPSLALALILSITGSLLAFDQFYILTKGGPDNSSLTIVQVIYRTAFQKFDLGGAAVLSLLLLLLLVVINLVQFRMLRGKDS